MLLRLALACVAMTALSLPAFGQTYQSAREARAAAAPFLRAKNYAAAQAPLEAALALTPETDVRERVDLYRTLMASYRLLPEPDKMLEAVDAIQRIAPRSAERSNVARDAVSFMHQRGKIDVAVKRYEEVLAKQPNDPAALAILAVIFSRIDGQDKARGEELEKQLEAVNKKRTSEYARQLEKEADMPAASAAFNWKNVAEIWIEAGELEQAAAAAEKSLAAQPEERSEILSMQWREGLGDVFSQAGKHSRAIEQYEAAAKLAPAEILKRRILMKIEKAKLAMRMV